MNWTTVFICSTVICVCIIIYLLSKLFRVKQQLSAIKEALEDIKNGNPNRRILTRENDMTKSICYSINEIAANNQAQLIKLKKSEQAYKRLMTSLSHDVKTPLASLVGYLEAVQEKIVTEKEKEEYIGVALEKAHRLKDFVEALFEWVKLDAGDEAFHFETLDLNELSRDILTDWIPVLEEKGFLYDIDIPETECNMQLDKNAYRRILNNLVQNVIIHSHGSRLSVHISEDERQAEIIVADNGKGIPKKDLPHIFERLYQGDESRTGRGNGLGLSIAKELVTIHGGTINAKCPPSGGTVIKITLPKKTIYNL